jgi:hypothetical protein
MYQDTPKNHQSVPIAQSSQMKCNVLHTRYSLTRFFCKSINPSVSHHSFVVSASNNPAIMLRQQIKSLHDRMTIPANKSINRPSENVWHIVTTDSNPPGPDVQDVLTQRVHTRRCIQSVLKELTSLCSILPYPTCSTE